MTPQTLARRAYAQPAAPTRTPRDTEYEAISRITQRLKAAAADKKGDFSAFVQALHANRQLWSVLAKGVSNAHNGLPEELRAKILFLAQFTEQHSSKVLGRTAEVEPLLEINMAVLRGLRQKGAA